MKISKIAALSFAGVFAASTHAAEPSPNDVLVQISYEDCHKTTEIGSYMKEAFNQTLVRDNGTLFQSRTALYANPEDDSYAIVVYPESATLVPVPKYPLACLFGPNKKTGYAEFRNSKQYQAIFEPR